MTQSGWIIGTVVEETGANELVGISVWGQTVELVIGTALKQKLNLELNSAIVKFVLKYLHNTI